MSLETPISQSLARDAERKEFIKPELGIEIKKDVLGSLAERYPDHREMFERFSRLPPIKFERGKVNFIFGPNGSGKSTLANAVFLVAEVAHMTAKKMAEPQGFDFRKNESKPKLTEEEARKGAVNYILHPSNLYNVAELVGMAAAPRLVEDGAIVLTQFQAREDTASLPSDTPIIHHIAVQDVLGAERRAEEEYMTHVKHDSFMAKDGRFSEVKSNYTESGGSARQMIEKKLRQEFEQINPGSIVIMDEAAFGLSPKRQEEYIQMLEKFAKEKELIVIAPENSGYAFDASSARIDLETPEKGLHVSEVRDNAGRAGVVSIETQEMLPGVTMEFAIDHNKIQQLAEANPQFRQMLEIFAKLPKSFAFGPGKTEIFADNGGGKTTMLGVMYLLMQIERGVKSGLEIASLRGRAEDAEVLRKKEMEHLVTRPPQPTDKVFIESLGFARELIASGAITLASVPEFPAQEHSTMEGVTGLMWMNLLDVSGEIKKDNFNIIEYARSGSIDEISKTIKEFRPNRTHGSTRQTAENLLVQTIQHMPEGGFLFVDEIDGGISPGRQLRISDAIHKLARDRKITVVATSNSYEGFKYRLTPSLDLFSPEQGITPATHKLETVA